MNADCTDQKAEGRSRKSRQKSSWEVSAGRAPLPKSPIGNPAILLARLALLCGSAFSFLLPSASASCRLLFLIRVIRVNLWPVLPRPLLSAFCLLPSTASAPHSPPPSFHPQSPCSLADSLSGHRNCCCLLQPRCCCRYPL